VLLRESITADTKAIKQFLEILYETKKTETKKANVCKNINGYSAVVGIIFKYFTK